MLRAKQKEQLKAAAHPLEQSSPNPADVKLDEAHYSKETFPNV